MRSILFFSLFTLLLSASAPAQMADYAGYKDPALFTRMPHYFLSGDGAFVDKAFDSYEFMAKPSNQTIEGHHLHYDYSFDTSAGAAPSTLQIVRNYEAAAKKIGGEVLFEDVRRATIRIAKGGKETWAFLEAFNEGREYELHIVERQLMQQEVLASAAEFQTGIQANGHVEVPGIFFDTAKSELKPESEPALAEVVKLLQANPALKVWVVGHTDNTGAVETNLALSAARAASVTKALTQKGIDPKRLFPHGAGPFAPVTSNETDAGRAHNRRVELVRQP